MTSSATGGYMRPSSELGLPKKLTLNQFIQTLLVGLSALDGQLVRPSWQPNPPKQPDGETNWLAFAVQEGDSDKYAFTGMDANGNTTLQRNTALTLELSFYGPDAFDLAGLVSDGFQIQQNLEVLTIAKMGFKEASLRRQMPDLVNERWISKTMLTVILVRENISSYPILPILSASGVIHAASGDETYLINWNVTNP